MNHYCQPLLVSLCIFILQALWIPVTVDDKDSAQSEDNAELVRGMTGIFLGGGDPWRLAEALMVTEAGARRDSPVMAAIREMWEAGGLVAGTSAGIMAMTRSQVITGGDSWESLVWGASEDTSMDSDVGGNLTYDALGGLNILQDVLIDAHFSQKARQGRLVRLAADLDIERGLGLDEDTGLACSGANLECEVIGTFGVWTLDMTSTEDSCDNNPGPGLWSCGGVKTSYLTSGDSLNLDSWVVKISENKDDMEVLHERAESSDDIFRKVVAEFERIAISLLESETFITIGRTLEDSPIQYFILFAKTPGTSAARNGDTGQVSYENLVLNFGYSSGAGVGLK